MRNIHRKARVKYYFCVIIIFSICALFFAQDIIEEYPESSSVREEILDSWFTQKIDLLRDQSAQVLQNKLGEYFLVRAEEKDGLMEIILAPLVIQSVEVHNLNNASGIINQNTNSFVNIETWPKDAMGSWVLYRDLQTGKNVRLRCYFMNEKDVYLEFFPGRDKSYIDFSIFGALVAHNAPVPVSFEYLITASLADVQKLTKNILPWKYVDISSNVYSESLQMVQVIRKLLPAMQEAKMFESDMGSYDFLRWIIDGLIRPLTGGTLYEEPLFVATTETNFMIPERQNTHKSFDFVRNLAAAAISAGTSLPYTYRTSNADVKIEPFAVITNAEGVKERVNFVTNIGYQMEVLKPLLYLLTATENDLFYLGAIRELSESGESGKKAEQYYYNNSAAFFSWFDSNGVFNVSVFENGAEFTLEQFMERYENSFVYLVRIKPSLIFSPEKIEVSEEEVLEYDNE